MLSSNFKSTCRAVLFTLRRSSCGCSTLERRPWRRRLLFRFLSDVEIPSSLSFRVVSRSMLVVALAQARRFWHEDRFGSRCLNRSCFAGLHLDRVFGRFDGIPRAEVDVGLGKPLEASLCLQNEMEIFNRSSYISVISLDRYANEYNMTKRSVKELQRHTPLMMIVANDFPRLETSKTANRR